MWESRAVTQSVIAEGIVIVLGTSGAGLVRHRRRQRQRVWEAWPRADSAPCQVTLFGGTRAGTTVTISGLPMVGAELDDGVIARVHRGCYLVGSVSPTERSAIAEWKPRE